MSQEVLSEVARSIRAFEYHPDRGRFRDWLGVLVRRKVIRFLRRKGRGAVDQGGDDPNAPGLNHASTDWDDAFNTRILGAALARARPHFEPATWQVFERVWLEDRRASDVAAELHTPIEMIHTAKPRVLKRLEEEVRILAEDVPQLVPLS